jgi:aminoglycoside phosphotransferase (APT) family kinase protein
MHPYLEYLAGQYGLEGKLAAVAAREPDLAPNFSVWLHGDLNINNIFYKDGQMQFIDVHRSHYGDYLSDIGVILISTLRKPGIIQDVRREMQAVGQLIIETVGDFGRTHGDITFTERLNLSLARSYITSSRIIADKNQARWLFEQGTKLLDSVTSI